MVQIGFLLGVALVLGFWFHFRRYKICPSCGMRSLKPMARQVEVICEQPRVWRVIVTYNCLSCDYGQTQSTVLDK